MPSRIQALELRRAAERRAQALPRAVAALDALAALGVDTGVIGSLARDRMLDHSDIDFAILDRGTLSFNDVLRVIDRAVQPLPFDAVFLDRMDPETRASFTRALRRAANLRVLARAA